MRLKPTVTWEVMFRSLVYEYRRFGVKYCTRIQPDVHRYIYARSPIFIDLNTWSSCFLLPLGTYPSNCTQAHLIRQISVIFVLRPYQKPHTLGNKWNVAVGYKIWVSLGIHYLILKILSVFLRLREPIKFLPSNPVAYPRILFGGGEGGSNKFSWGQRTGIWGP